MTSASPPYGNPEPGSPARVPDIADSEVELRLQALKRLKAKRAFRAHVFAYFCVNGLLWAIWFVTGLTAGGDAWFPWPIFPALGWGIGLAFHAYAVFGTSFQAITEQEIAAEMQRLRRR